MANYKRFDGLTDSIVHSVREVVTASSKSAAELKAQEVQKYAAKYESVRPQAVEKAVRPIERVYASMRPTSFAAKEESIAERVQMIAEEMGTTPKTEKHRKLAAFAPPKDKITHADILRGRGVPAARGGSRGATSEETVAEQDKLWPGTPEWKKKFGTDQEKHELKFGKSDVKKLKPYGEREDSPMSAQTKGRGRPKKIRTEEVEEIDEALTVNLPGKHAESRYKSVIAHAKKMGYNVHHNEHFSDEKSGNKGTPDITVHYERGDHRDNADPVAIAVHKDGKANKDSTLASIIRGKLKEEVEELDEMGPGKLPRIDKKVENEYGNELMKDFLARGGKVKQVKSPALPRNRNRMVAPGSLSSGERTVTRSGGKSFTSRMGEEKDTPGQDHQCALHVKHAKLGEGRTLFSQHAEPFEDGSIEWYDVMFEHGIERVMTAEVEILVSESHMNHKKKGK